jgi:hypothetical protein
MEGTPNNFDLRFQDIKNKLIEEIEERVTTPSATTDFTLDDFEKISGGLKIEKTREKASLLVRICQDIRLTPDEVDLVLDRVFQ